MSNREQDVQAHWKAIELTAEQWSKARPNEPAATLLAQIKTHWDTLVLRLAHDKVRIDALTAENLALKNEISLLKRRFGVGKAPVVPQFLRADRSTTN